MITKGMTLEEHKYLQAKNTWLEPVRLNDAELAAILENLDSLGRVLTHLEKTSDAELLAQQAEGARRPWYDAGLFYFHTGRTLDAAAVFHRLYERLCGCQRESKTWVAKSLPLERIMECHERLGHPAESKWYLLLTAVSDAIRDMGRLESDSGVFLKGLQLGWDAGKLRAFYADCNSVYDPNDPLCGFPEHLLSLVDTPFPTPYVETAELDIYEINKVYAATILALLNDKCGDRTGKALERLAGYFLGRVPGFGAVPGFQSADAQYDGMIRNTGRKYDFRADLGFYLLVECKDWRRPIGVSEVSQFINKLVLQDCRGGILFSSKGITGAADTRNAELQLLKAYYRAGKIILVLKKKTSSRLQMGQT